MPDWAGDCGRQWRIVGDNVRPKTLTRDASRVSLSAVSMSFRIRHYPGLALIVLAIGLSAAHADEPAPSRSTPAIFSSPSTRIVSSNLNQIGTRSSPLTDLESGLKKPFELFNLGLSPADSRPTKLKYVPPAPVINNKKLKDLMEKRTEDMYLSTEGDRTAQPDDAWFDADDAFSSASDRRKSSLDRYHDRLDRQRLATTNETSRPLALFGLESDPEAKDDLKPRRPTGLFDNELSASARVLQQMSNSSSDGGRLSSENRKPRSFGDIFGLGSVETSQAATRTRETRMDEFKRLLDGPGYTARGELNTAPRPSVSAPYQPPKPVVSAPSQGWSISPKPAAGETFANTHGFAGALTQPVGVPDYAASSPSLTPAPTHQLNTSPKLPPPTFSIPRRRF